MGKRAMLGLSRSKRATDMPSLTDAANLLIFVWGLFGAYQGLSSTMGRTQSRVAETLSTAYGSLNV
jgi:hypothetical protein